MPDQNKTNLDLLAGGIEIFTQKENSDVPEKGFFPTSFVTSTPVVATYCTNSFASSYFAVATKHVEVAVTVPAICAGLTVLLFSLATKKEFGSFRKSFNEFSRKAYLPMATAGTAGALLQYFT